MSSSSQSVKDAIKTFESNKETLQKYIAELDKKCKASMGPKNKYVCPENPYNYTDKNEFVDEVIGENEFNHIKKHCKFLVGTDTSQDPTNKYFTKISEKQECDAINGHWDSEAINRKNKWSKGVCWVEELDKKCAAQVDSRLLRAHNSKYMDSSDIVADSADKCHQIPECSFKKKTKYTYDCEQGQREEEKSKESSGPIMNPPPDMPAENSESFLEKWYKSVDGPDTAELLGTGNRCIHQAIEDSDKPIEPGKFIPEPYIDYRHLDPNKKDDANILKSKMSANAFLAFHKEYNIMKRYGWDRYIEMYKDKSKLKYFYDLRDKEQFQFKDPEIIIADPKTAVKVQKKGMFPSIPQSVVNMVMKNVAIQNTKKRGILANHSTGSGKCHGIDTPILMFDGSIKFVQDILIGDILMGDDSTPRQVLDLGTGEDEMYRITDETGSSYVVNSQHILCLKTDSSSKVYEMTVSDYLSMPLNFSEFKSYRVPIEFKTVCKSINSDPWTIGCMNTSKIPDEYKINTREIRLGVLAGIIDSCGLFINKTYEITGCRCKEDIIYIARSLGFLVYINDDTIIIKGDIETIPVKNKVIYNTNLNTNLNASFKIEHIGFDKYYGFTLDSNHRYVLGDFTVTHNTCTATGVIDAFWDTDRPIVFASSIDAIASNPPYAFHEYAYNFFPRFKTDEFKGRDKAESLALIAAGFKKRNVKFLSFAKLSHRVHNAVEYKKQNKLSGGAPRTKTKPISNAKKAREEAKKAKEEAKKAKEEAKKAKTKTKKTEVKTKKTEVKAEEAKVKAEEAKEEEVEDIPKAKAAQKRGGPKTHEQILEGESYVDLTNAVIIIDEVQNLFKPLPNQKKEHDYLTKLLENHKMFPNLKLVILTATPGDNIPDILQLLNIIRNADAPEIKMFDINNPDSIQEFKNSIRGLISFFDMSADDTKFPKVIDNPMIKLPMSEAQFTKYVEAYKTVKAEQKNFKALSKKNELNKYWEPARKYANMMFNFNEDMGLNDFSCKLPAVLDIILKYSNDKHYLYSAFSSRAGYGGHGSFAVSKELDKLGYTKMTIKEAKKYNKSGKLPEKAKRYIIVINSELNEEAGNAGDNLGELLKIYNCYENRNGELIHIMLASNNYNEGLDLKDVAHIHLLEPLVSMASEKQAIGRAVRNCSFKNKDRAKGEWVVNIHRYMADKPDIKYVDKDVIRQAINKEIAELEDKTGDIKEIKKEIKALEKKGADASKLKAQLENADIYIKQIKEKQKELKKLDAPAKVEKVTIENIEELIFEESRERYKELLTVYLCFKTAAIDCRLLKEFHEATSKNTNKIKCDF